MPAGISINEGSNEGIHSVYERIYEGINLWTFDLVWLSTGLWFVCHYSLVYTLTSR